MSALTDAPLLGERLSVKLMNTVWADRTEVRDALATDAAALSWLRAVAPRFPPDGPDVSRWLRDDRPSRLGPTAEQLRALRDAVRALAAELTQDPRPPVTSRPTRADAVRTVNRLAAASLRWPLLSWPEGGAPAAGHGQAERAGTAAVSWLAADAVKVLTGADALRACLAPGCVLYLLRRPARREWCSAACGNRARVARHYQRTRTDPSTTL